LTDSLLARTARGAGWVMAWRLGMRVLGLTSTLVLVRLLIPADFGLIALATGFVQSVDGLMSLGTDEAVIREADPGRSVYDTAFTLNALRGLVASLIVAVAAYPAAGFFGDPRLGPVLLVVALLPLLDGLSNIGAVDFRRNMTFHKEFALMVLPKLCGILAAIAAAFLLRSYVAMLCGMIVNRSMRMAMTYVMHPFRPRFGLHAWRTLVGYSVWTWLLSLAALLRDRSDSLILGRIAGASILGFYSVGAEIAALPMTELVEPLGRSAFSGFAAARHEGAEVRDTFLRLIGFSALLALPIGMGLSQVAAPLTRLALGPGWESAVPVLQVLGVAGTMLVFGHLGQHLLSAHALLGRLVGITLGGAALRVVLLLALVPRFGATGAAIAAAVAIAVEQGAILATAARRFGIGAGALAEQVWRPLVATAAMAAVLWASGLGWVPTEQGNGLGALVAGVGVGAIVFAAVLPTLWLLAGRPVGAEADALRAIWKIRPR
jgi:lipopolysaccharide exporter